MADQDWWNALPSAPKTTMSERKDIAGLRSSSESATSSAATRRREDAEFILKYGIRPEDVTPSRTIPGDITKTGEEYLQTLDPSLAKQVKMLAEGRRAFPTGAALRNPSTMQLIAAATQYDPQLDAANAATRVATRKDFTSGMSARNLTALNTAVGHLATLRKLSTELNNSNFPAVNTFVNYLQSEQLGDPRVRNYKTAAMAFAGELAKVFKGTGAPSLTELKDWEEQLDENMSPAQFEGFVETAADLLGSRINAVGDTYNRGLNTSAEPITLLSPHAQELFDTINAPLRREKLTVGIDERIPEGAQITGEPVQGFRFNPETEAKLLAYDRSPDATPEGATKLVVEAAVKEGLIKPEQQQSYGAATLANMREFFKQPPEVRAQVGSVDYAAIDRAATENAGLGASVSQGFRNLPESGALMLQGLVNMPKTVGMLGTAAGEVFTGADEAPTTDALKAAIEERYGSTEALKRTAITDPLGLGADMSIALTGGGSLAARLPGTAGRIGGGVATAGRLLDPLSGAIGLATEGAPAAYRAAQQRTPGAVRGLGDLPSEIAGFPSGSGGAALREATGAGFERGVTGAPTPRSEALTTEMRQPGTSGEMLLNAAQDAIRVLRDQGSANYNRLMQQFGQNPTPLDITTVQARMQQLKPRSYDTWSQRQGERPPTHRAWEQMNDFVNEYAGMAQRDPNLLMPLEMDQFKQDLYDVGARFGGVPDREAARFAGQAYNAVRQELVRHDPIYASAMREYETVAREAKDLETTFGLAVARGKRPSVEGVSRRLQAAMRNNANVGYGTRERQARRLNELDPDGTIVPTLAGSQLSALRPRGLNSAVALGLGSATMNPAVLLGAPAFIPRVMGEAAYGAGRLAGTATRAGRRAAQSDLGQASIRLGEAAADLYQRRPTLALGAAQLGARGEDAERQALRERYSDEAVPLLPRDKFDEELEKARLLREYGLLD